MAEAQDLSPGSFSQEQAVLTALWLNGAVPNRTPFVFLRTSLTRLRTLEVSGNLPVERLESFFATSTTDSIEIVTLLPDLAQPLIDHIPNDDEVAWRTLRDSLGLPKVRVVTITRPGFDAAGLHAVVLIGEICGTRCGNRATRYLLTRNPAGWSVTSKSVGME